MPRLVLYPFKFRDRITGRWVRARLELQYPELQRRYAEWEITGAPVIRHVAPIMERSFTPFRSETDKFGRTA